MHVCLSSSWKHTCMGAVVQQVLCTCAADCPAACRMPCTNTYGAVWEAGLNHESLPGPPVDLRITNTLGQQVCNHNCFACT